MIGIVLAAGKGRRLGATDDLPKPLVTLGGHTLIATVLRRLDDLDLEAIVVVVGHAAGAVSKHVESLRLRHRVSFVHNERFESTNNLYSLALTTPLWDNGFLVSDSDLLTSPATVQRLWNTPGSGILVDRSRADRFDLGAHVVDGRVVELSKDLPTEKANGEGLGMSIWRASDVPYLAAEVRQLLDNNGEQLWYPYAVSAVASKVHVQSVEVTNTDWWEVDTPVDLAQGRRKVKLKPDWSPDR